MNSLEKSEFKNAASKFASGIVIAITNYQEEDNELSHPWHGMTISSFTTISMDPMLIMIAVSKKAKMHELLLQQQDNCKFSISVLSEHQKELSSHFAGQKIKEISNSLESNVIHLGNDYTFIKGCLSYFLCELNEAYDKGDHTLFFGNVVDTQTFENNKMPLIYYSRSYNKLKVEN
jgi:flavin reductase (DIM6/NTAB) family NADH-FMN oxidoreductase RutF